MSFKHHARTILLTCVIAASLGLGASGDTVVTYDQSTGNLRIAFDGVLNFQRADHLLAVQFDSASKSLKRPPTWPSGWQSTPAILDVDDLPGILTVLFIPVGVTEIPGAVEVGTPINDLTAQIFNFSPWVQEFVPIGVPEPQSVSLAASGLLILAGLRRRK